MYLGENIGKKLIDDLDSIVKAITGNVDQNDTIKFNNDSKALKLPINTDRSYQKRTIRIMQDFINEYEFNLKKY